MKNVAITMKLSFLRFLRLPNCNRTFKLKKLKWRTQYRKYKNLRKIKIFSVCYPIWPGCVKRFV